MPAKTCARLSLYFASILDSTVPLLLSSALKASLALTILFAGTAPSAEVADGRRLAATCANCHGTDGHGRGGIKSLAGRSNDEIMAALRGFRSGSEPATIMNQIVKGYREVQLQAIADFYSAQPAPTDR